MSFYTGRYVQSHGAAWNDFPLKVGEMTLGDHLRPLGVRTALVGKTHMKADIEGMARLGIDPDSVIGVRVAECGFEPYERDDGLHGSGPDGKYDPRVPRYKRYLREHGYSGDNPWDDWANAGEDAEGNLLSGWLLQHCAQARADPGGTFGDAVHDAARDATSSRTRATRPGACISPTSSRTGPTSCRPRITRCTTTKDVVPAVRAESERADPHPVYREFMNHRVGKAFSREEVRRGGDPGLHGADQADRRPDRAC